MTPAIESLTKQAEELTDRLGALEKENAELAAQVKQAKEASQKPVQLVSDEVAQATCSALVAAGAITEDQSGQIKQAYMSDPEASHRTIHGLIDAQAQSKTAACSRTADLSGGKLLASVESTRPYEDVCLDRMLSILNMSVI